MQQAGTENLIHEALQQYPLHFKQNIAWGDMDAFGHVNNVMYYRYVESARIAYFEHLGFFLRGFTVVVSYSDCRYLRPVFYPDQLMIGVRVDELRQSAMRMSYLLWSEQQQNIVAQGEAILVSMDKSAQGKRPLSEDFKRLILDFEATVNHQVIQI